jgi:predicted ABC-type ATPase
VRRAVAAECERFVVQHLDAGRSFAVETTLRTLAAVAQAELARSRGFTTHLRFLATDSIEVNISRVLQRAQAGGHGASERDIRTIHTASLANLPAAIRAFERVRVYDSTRAWIAPSLVATARNGLITRHGSSPAWLDRAL